MRPNGWEMRRRCGFRALNGCRVQVQSWSLNKVSPRAVLGDTAGSGTLMVQPPCDRTRLVGDQIGP